MDTNYLQYKIAITGDASTGKSSLILYYSKNISVPNAPSSSTIGVEFFTKILQIDDKKIKLNIWDTAGQERFRSIIKSYYRNCLGMIVCFSLINKTSFDNLSHYINTIKQSNEYMPIITIVGTFSDQRKNRVVMSEDVQNFIADTGLNIEYFETSSVTGENIHKIFEHITKKINEKVEEGILFAHEHNNVSYEYDKPKSKKCC